MFENSNFTVHSFEDVPLGRDIFLMDEKWASGREAAWLDVFSEGDADPYAVGYVSFIAADQINSDSIEVEWYPDTFKRFHSVSTFLPRSAFVTCVCAYGYEKRPTLFVKSEWIERLFARTHSTFAMVDVCGFGALMRQDGITSSNLLKVRSGIDELAASNPNIAFTSFADSLLLKTNWNVGTWENPSTAAYQPEEFLKLLADVDDIYQSTFGVGTYAVLAQGSNDLFGDELFHTAPSGNHISLNSLGLPFAQIAAIEAEARRNIRCGLHEASELYLDRPLFLSLHIKDNHWKADQKVYEYDQKLVAKPGNYLALSRQALSSALEN